MTRPAAALIAFLTLIMTNDTKAGGCELNKLILLIDFNSAQGSTGKASFKQGLESFLGNDNLEGQLQIYFLKEKTAEATKQLCLEPIPVEAPLEPRQSQSWLTWAKEQVAGDGGRKKENVRLRRIVDRLQRERKETAEHLVSSIGLDNTQAGAKELLPAIVSVIQSECSQEAGCQIFLFSNLRDSRSKMVMDNTRIMSVEYARKLGDQDADLVRQNLNAKRPSAPISFKVWGQEIGGEDQRKLAQYWAGALSSLNVAKGPEPQIAARFAW